LLERDRNGDIIIEMLMYVYGKKYIVLINSINSIFYHLTYMHDLSIVINWMMQFFILYVHANIYCYILSLVTKTLYQNTGRMSR